MLANSSTGFLLTLVGEAHTSSERGVDYRRQKGPRHRLNCCAAVNYIVAFVRTNVDCYRRQLCALSVTSVASGPAGANPEDFQYITTTMHFLKSTGLWVVWRCEKKKK